MLQDLSPIHSKMVRINVKIKSFRLNFNLCKILKSTIQKFHKLYTTNDVKLFYVMAQVCKEGNETLLPLTDVFSFCLSLLVDVWLV